VWIGLGSRSGLFTKVLAVSKVPPDRPCSGQFPTTHWSRVVSAGDPDAPGAREALASLCGAYWFPLYAYIRRRGYPPAEAEDLTQGFFAYLLEGGLLAKAEPGRGHFRSFLRTVCSNYLAMRSRREHAQMRGGGRIGVSIDVAEAEGRYVRELSYEASPEWIFDRAWAVTLLGRVLAQLRQEHEARGAETFEALQDTLTEGRGGAKYATIAERLGLSEGAVRVAVHRLRRRYGELLRSEIATTVADPDEVDDEIRDLFSALES
jgi:RNA polymerase sigma-70 factor (ECF subfamily)